MAVSYERIRPRFERLRDFVLKDRDRIVGEPVGGNYAATAIIVCAYDAIADLRHGNSGRGHLAFEATLPDEWKPLAKSLYDALRNGLVHAYETKRISVDGREIELLVSWRGRRHLSLDTGRVYLNVPRMADDLRRAFDDYDTTLRSDAAMRERFWKRSEQDRVQPVGDRAEVAAWRELLEAHTADAPWS